jgi:hypothetical protein
MPDTRMQSWRHHDARDDLTTIALYADIGIGPAVIFDEAGFTDPGALRAFAADLMTAADLLEAERTPADAD